MYIEPNTNIKLLSNIALDNTYTNTIYFNNASEQTSWFSTKSRHNLTNQSYQRVTKGKMRVGLSALSIYDCNYMMFQNTSFGGKWFYAFILNIEYINNECCEITYEIDVIQTWLFDIELKECFVEREHSETDEVGDNLMVENLETGDYVVSNLQVANMMEDGVGICILASDNPDASTPTGKMVNGVYTPTCIQALPLINDPEGIASVNSIFQEYGGRIDAIYSVFEYPLWLGDGATKTPKVFNLQPDGSSVTVNRPSSLDGYIPKNNKLFTYPYCQLVVTNTDRNTGTFRYEEFSEQSYQFKIEGVFVPDVAILCSPLNYRGVDLDIDNGISLTDMPQCAWTSDAYEQWLNQNKNQIAMSLVSGVISGITKSGIVASGGGLTQGNFSGGGGFTGVGEGVSDTFTQVGNLVAKISDIKAIPDSLHGQPHTNSLSIGLDRIRYTFYGMTLKYEYAKTIDDYFTMFGYASHKVKLPNRTSRPHWNYLKTVGCNVIGLAPVDDINKWCTIHNKGITYWKNGDEIGNYSLDNSV